MEISKLSGIYEISNKINDKKYIGHSINIILRWYLHIDNLFKNIHPNSKLQEDFNTYGLNNFNFSILELIDGKKNLIAKEQEYLNNINFDYNYNVYNSIKNSAVPQTQKFIDYINAKWLVPDGITDKNELDKYKIYKDEDKQEIVNKVIEYKLLKLCASKITFNKTIDLMENSFGYTIESNRMNINKKKYTYKLIVDFDEDKISFQHIVREI